MTTPFVFYVRILLLRVVFVRACFPRLAACTRCTLRPHVAASVALFRRHVFPSATATWPRSRSGGE